MEKEYHLTPLARVQPLAGLFDKNKEVYYIHCISGNVSYRNTNTTVQQYMNMIIYCGAVCRCTSMRKWLTNYDASRQRKNLLQKK